MLRQPLSPILCTNSSKPFSSRSVQLVRMMRHCQEAAGALSAAAAAAGLAAPLRGRASDRWVLRVQAAEQPGALVVLAGSARRGRRWPWVRRARPLPAPAAGRACWAPSSFATKDRGPRPAVLGGCRPVRACEQQRAAEEHKRQTHSAAPLPVAPTADLSASDVSQAMPEACPAMDGRSRYICASSVAIRPAGACGSGAGRASALTMASRPGHVSGPPVSGWWQRRGHFATSYSKVGVSAPRTMVSGREHRGQARVSRRMADDMIPGSMARHGAHPTSNASGRTAFPLTNAAGKDNPLTYKDSLSRRETITFLDGRNQVYPMLKRSSDRGAAPRRQAWYR